MTTSQPNTPPQRTPPPLCQVCQERPGQGYIGQLLVCGHCFDEAKHEEIRLYRFSLKLVEGGYPR